VPPLGCWISNRLLNFSNCFSFETYLGSFRSTTVGATVIRSSTLPEGLAVPELSGSRQLVAAAATVERDAHEKGIKFVSV